MAENESTVSIGAWAPEVPYFMRPFTCITFTDGSEDGVTFDYNHLGMVAGPYATFLDELHILIDQVRIHISTLHT
jgi:hypothetical protein